MKYLSLLLLIGFTLGQKYDVQTGSSNESFKPKGFKLKVIEKLAVKNVKRGARKWILYSPAVVLTGGITMGVREIIMHYNDWSGWRYSFGQHMPYEVILAIGIGVTGSLTMPYLLLKKWDNLHKPPAHLTYSEKKIYRSIYEKKYRKFKKKRLFYSTCTILMVSGIGGVFGAFLVMNMGR